MFPSLTVNAHQKMQHNATMKSEGGLKGVGGGLMGVDGGRGGERGETEG